MDRRNTDNDGPKIVMKSSFVDTVQMGVPPTLCRPQGGLELNESLIAVSALF